VIDKGEEVAGKVFDKVNPLSQTGFYIALGIGASVLVELFNSKAGETFARTVSVVEIVRPWYIRLLQCVKGYIIKPK